MERQKMKKKGFTLVELLVVIAIIAMLLAILMPALGKVRQLAQRIMCGTNLAGVGKAMLTYSTDDKYESFPVAGSPGAYWNRGTGGIEGINSWDWRNPNAFPETITIKFTTLSANLYLLVKYADVSPDQYVCPGSDQKKFELSKYSIPTAYATNSFTDVWDFGSRDTQKTTGSRAKGHNSYSYQLPMPIASTGTGSGIAYPITTTSNPARAIMADRNPYWQTPDSATASPARLYVWDSVGNKLKPDSIAAGNNTYHQKDGQNVLYADQHAKFEKSANCGVESDNIYTIWGSTTTAGYINPTTEENLRQCGIGTTMAGTTAVNPMPIQTNNEWYPRSADDNYLVSDIDKAE
ncbi:MAG: type II secretion system protein [Phycisphaerae bacterium]|jgi:type II secretory pathway pseudopilin PulG